MSADGKETWIETRGQGDYFLTFPSPGYKLIDNTLEDTPVISSDEKKILHSIARSFTEKQEGIPRKYNTRETEGRERPGDDFNHRIDREAFHELLESEGWKFTGKVTSGGEHFTRPGKTEGTSATLKDGCFYVFSTNAGLPIGPNSAFDVYTYKHRKNGYGKGTFLDTSMFLSEAFISLGARGSSPTVSHASVKILMMLLGKRRFSKMKEDIKKIVRSDDNKFTLTYKELDSHGINRKTATRGFDELLAKGFISIVDPDGAYKQHKAVYALEKDYLSWQPQETIRMRKRDILRGYQKNYNRGGGR